MTTVSPTRTLPSASQGQGQPQYNVRDAALKGASTAFNKPPLKPKPLVNTYTGNNGALVAATLAGNGHTSENLQKPSSRGFPASPRLRPLSRQSTGGSSIHSFIGSPASSHLQIPLDGSTSRSKSPSNIAAALAAARFSPNPPKLGNMNAKDSTPGEERAIDMLPAAGTVGDMKAKLGVMSGGTAQQTREFQAPSSVRRANTGIADPHKPTDDTSIAPTNSLVKMFEQTQTKVGRDQQNAMPKQKPAPIGTSCDGSPPLKSPKPVRRIPIPFANAMDDGRESTKVELAQSGMGMIDDSESASIGQPTKPPKPAKPAKPAQVDKGKLSSPSPSLVEMARHPQRSSTVPLSAVDAGMDETSSSSEYESAPETTQAEARAKPDLPPPRRKGKTPTNVTASDIPLSKPLDAVPRKTSPPKPPPSRGVSQHSESFTRAVASPINPYQQLSLRQITPHMSGDSLANAIVGAALASTRASTPTESPVPPLPMWNGKSHHHHHHHHPFHTHGHPRSRSDSPSKRQPGMLRRTLREEESSSSSDENTHKRSKRFLGRKHPNKHHEGARKRWRDKITERERKRYEGVWAANKGVLIPVSSNPSINAKLQDEVLNLVVRDIWMRSRLPEHVLEEVWALVDGQGVGRLRREEFVVGMWLIDQRLKGRKLPVKVSHSVWGSVRLVGVKVKVGKG